MRKFPSLARLCGLFVVFGLTDCAYVQSTARQALYNFSDDFRRDDRPDKRLLRNVTYFVFGKVPEKAKNPSSVRSVVALSKVKNNWLLIDRKDLAPKQSEFMLNLPEGEYQLLMLDNGGQKAIYTAHDIVGSQPLSLPIETGGKRVVAGLVISCQNQAENPDFARLRVPVRPSYEPTVLSLNDPRFSSTVSRVGLYNPPQFLDISDSLMYCLGRDDVRKNLIIFVHGISGSAQEFREIAQRIDTTKYSLWFFHYPSGYDLNLISEAFYELALSGRHIATQGREFVIVAHSMGGLVVREAINQLRGQLGEARITKLITIASPIGGMSFAGAAGSAPLVLPVWRDLAPESTFIKKLHRNPLPKGLSYCLLYTSGEAGPRLGGEPGDGVVPISAQLSPAALREASFFEGFDEGHTGVLKSRMVSDSILDNISEGPAKWNGDVSLTRP